jgi:uncharacterized protein (UPF0264 family)
MTQLLVSVRDAAEARVALAAGAAIIDIKEPDRGALGAADATSIADVVREVDGRVRVSAALGELAQWESADLETAAFETQLAPGLSFAKLGLAGCAALPDWRQRWSAAVGCFPGGIAPVAVVYADWLAAAAPPPADVLRQARPLGCRAVLVDTFNKRSGGLFDHWPEPDLGLFLAAVRDARLLTVLAGSLNVSTIPRAITLRPDYIAVRGAACQGSRAGTIDGERVAGLVASIRALVDGAGA